MAISKRRQLPLALLVLGSSVGHTAEPGDLESYRLQLSRRLQAVTSRAELPWVDELYRTAKARAFKSGASKLHLRQFVYARYAWLVFLGKAFAEDPLAMLTVPGMKDALTGSEKETVLVRHLAMSLFGSMGFDWQEPVIKGTLLAEFSSDPLFWPAKAICVFNCGAPGWKLFHSGADAAVRAGQKWPFFAPKFAVKYEYLDRYCSFVGGGPREDGEIALRLVPRMRTLGLESEASLDRGEAFLRKKLSTR